MEFISPSSYENTKLSEYISVEFDIEFTIPEQFKNSVEVLSVYVISELPITNLPLRSNPIVDTTGIVLLFSETSETTYVFAVVLNSPKIDPLGLKLLENPENMLTL